MPEIAVLVYRTTGIPVREIVPVQISVYRHRGGAYHIQNEQERWKILRFLSSKMQIMPVQYLYFCFFTKEHQFEPSITFLSSNQCCIFSSLPKFAYIS